jgi:two-component system C4-dicarboxylate transport sensor histidine kinase DctB
MVNERRRHLRDRLAARELQAAHDELERKVEQRTPTCRPPTALQAEVAERTHAEATLRAAQDELVQAGKLAVIGQLSTGIAHELNQPLTALRTWPATASAFWSAAIPNHAREPGAHGAAGRPHGPHHRPAAQLCAQVQRQPGRAAGACAGQCAGRAGAARRDQRRILRDDGVPEAGPGATATAWSRC